MSILLKESKLSPELLADRMGLSGMTVRRWIEKPSPQPLPAMYQAAIRDTVYKLLVEGILSHDSKSVKAVLAHADSLPFEVAIKNSGFSPNLSEVSGDSHNQILVGLTQIGASEQRKDEVNRNKKKILSFRKLSADWSHRVTQLMNVINSKEIHSVDKFAAFGALFYLLNPFDLIPDHIPVFGLVDDFALLGLVVSYYSKRFSTQNK